MQVEDIPVAVFAYKRPEPLKRTLDCIREAGFRNVIGFSDAPRSPNDEEGVQRCRDLFHGITWASVEVVEREENIGSAQSIITGTNHVLERSEQAVLIEDDVLVAPGFGRFVTAALDRYADEPSVASVTGIRMPFSRRAFHGYRYDAFMLPRYFSWSTGVWRRSWKTFDFDCDRLVNRLRASGIRTELAGPDLTWNLRSLYRKTLHDAFDVNAGLSMLLNRQVSVVPTWNMALHVGHGDDATHFNVAPRWTHHQRWEPEREPDLDALRFPPPEPDHRIVKSFRIYRENPQGWTARRFVPRPAREVVRRVRGTYDPFR